MVSSLNASRPPCRGGRRSVRDAFTLVELLIVIGMIAVLMGMLMPAVVGAREAAQRARCLANQHNVGAAITAYAMTNSGSIPYGPTAPPALPLSFYPATGDVTSLISLLQGGQPVGLGLMLKNELAATPRSVFCPGADQPDTAEEQLARVGHTQVQSDYYYRHAGNVGFIDEENVTPPANHIRLAALGLNDNGAPIRALVMDVNFNCPADPTLALFGVVPRTNHRQRVVCTLYADGHAEALDNADRSLSIDASNVYYSLINIRMAFERADVR